MKDAVILLGGALLVFEGMCLLLFSCLALFSPDTLSEVLEQYRWYSTWIVISMLTLGLGVIVVYLADWYKSIRKWFKKEPETVNN